VSSRRGIVDGRQQFLNLFDMNPARLPRFLRPLTAVSAIALLCTQGFGAPIPKL